jgi:hypothetical protein
MTRQIALRIIWKEYRVHRSMWCFMFAICIAVQVLCVVFGDTADDIVIVQLVLGSMFTFFFAVSSSATTFSSECEDGTQVRQLSLGASPCWALSLKGASCLLGTALMLGLMSLSATLMSNDTTWIQELFGASRLSRSSVDPLVRGLVIAGVLSGAVAVGIFYSLLFARPLLAVACAVLTTFVGFGTFTGAGTEYGFKESTLLIAAFAAIAGLTAANYWMVIRWYWNLKQPLDSSRFLASLGLSRSSTTELAQDHASADVQAAPSWALGRLNRNWGRNPIRMIRFMRWKEAIETRTVFVGISVVVLALTLLCATKIQIPSSWTGLTSFLLFTSAMVLGLATFRSEQRDDSFRFLRDRGLSPTAVWFSKLSVWAARFVVLSGLIVWVYGANVTDRQFIDFVASTGLGGYANLALESITTALVGRAILILLLFFAIGQMASLCFRKALVGVFVAIMLGLATVVWSNFTSSFGVPVYLSTLPAIPVLFAMSWARARGWMLGETGFSSWKGPLLVAGLGVIACCGLPMWYRGVEIPAGRPFVSTDPAGNPRVNGLTVKEWQAFLADVSPAEKATADLIITANGNVRTPSMPKAESAFTKPHVWSDLDVKWHEWLEAHSNTVDILVDASGRDACAFDSPATRTMDDSPLIDRYEELVCLMLLSAAKLQHENQHEMALDRLELTFKLCRHLEGRGSVLKYLLGERLSLIACVSIQQWSASKQVNDELRSRADAIVQNHEKASHRLSTVVASEFRTYENSIRQGPKPRSGLGDSTRIFWRSFWYWLPGEGARRDSLLAHLKFQSAASIDAFHNRVAAEERLNVGLYENDSLTAREFLWLEHSPFLGFLKSSPITPPYDSFLDRMTNVRATRLILKLHSLAAKSGSLPDTFPTDLAEITRDPWTGADFFWKPKGLPRPISHGKSTIPAHTPFISSAGFAGPAWAKPYESNDDSNELRFAAPHANVYLIPPIR